MCFDSWTRTTCRHPFLVIAAAIVAIIAASFGLKTIEMVNDPVSLWSSPTSTARIQKNFFDDHFGPFFRIQQVIVSTPPGRDPGHFEYTFTDEGPDGAPVSVPVNVSNLFKADLFKELLMLESNLSALVVPDNDQEQFNGTGLDQICYSPLSSGTGTGRCVIQSPLNYFQSNVSVLERDPKMYLDHIRSCIKNSASPSDPKFFNVPCLGSFGGPGFPNVVFGGYDDPPPCPPKNETSPSSNSSSVEESIRILSSSTSLVISILIKNHPVGSVERAKAERWESLFLEHMDAFVSSRLVDKRRNGDGNQNLIRMAGQEVTVSYFSERSVEDEIERQSRSDVVTIALSYLVMFGYVSLSLGQYIKPSRIFVDSKMALGLAGVLIVLASVSSSIGLTAYFGSKGTLIIVEVLPFLVLAVGVDNIFILVQNFQRTGFLESRTRSEGQESLEDRMARSVVAVGPSILLSAAAESSCFLIGSFLSSMPAVNAFALNAAIALLISLLLQFSLFLSLFFLDTKRQLESRIDLFFCFGGSNNDGSGQEEAAIQLLREAGSKSRIQSLFSRYFVPFVATKSRSPRICFTIFLVVTTCLTLAIVPDLKVGLEQEISMPQDSYVLNYFKDQKSKLKVGAPVYFVLESVQEPSSKLLLNFSQESNQDLVCGGGSCSNTSLVSMVKMNARQSARSRISGPVNSWIDDYLTWVTSPSCCQSFSANGSFCPSSLGKEVRITDCVPCDGVSEKRPPDFYRYLNWFLSDDPTRDCAVGGHAQYSTALSFVKPDPVANGSAVVGSSWFMAYHKPAPTSDHFVASVIEARKLASDIETNLKAGGSAAVVFPYSVFYVYYEQYLR